MKALVLFRSFHGNTKEVAEAMAKEINRLGHEAQVQDLRLRLPDLADVGGALVGAPTRMARVTRKAYRALKRLRRKRFGDRPVAIFDTYGPESTDPAERGKSYNWLYPGAAGRMQEKAKTLGLNVYPQTLRCEVQGMKGPLKKGEAEKAAAFAREFMKKAGKS